MNILGVITARGGSKGIPGKNIKHLGPKPLIVYTIEVAKKSKLVTHLIVSTNDKEVANICTRHGVEVPFMRPEELATDTVGHLEVMQHAIQFMEEKLDIKFDYTVILQPTSPFRQSEDIDNTLKVLIESGADSAVSLVKVPSSEHPIKVKKMKSNKVLPYCMPEPEGIRRQDFPLAYKRSSHVYAMRRATLVDKNRLYGDTVAGYVVSEERFIDIDTPLDWIKAEYMLDDLKKKGFLIE